MESDGYHRLSRSDEGTRSVVKKKVIKPKPPTQVPTDLEEFQSQYGGDWLKITQHPAFMAGMQLLNVRKFKGITFLSNEEIEKHSKEILSNLIGHLKHEEDLFTLHEKREEELISDEGFEYLSPEQAAEQQQLIEKFREQTKRDRYHA